MFVRKFLSATIVSVSCATMLAAPAHAAQQTPTEAVTKAIATMPNRDCADFSRFAGTVVTHDDIVNGTINAKAYKGKGINPELLRALGEATAARMAVCGYLSAGQNPPHANNRSNTDGDLSSEANIGSLLAIIVTIGTIGALIASTAQQYGLVPKR